MANELTTERKVYLDFMPANLEMTNYNELLHEVEKYASRYKGLVFSRAEKQGANQARSELLALRNSIENERKEVKAVYNNPLKKFEADMKVLTDKIDEPLNEIREGLKIIEQVERDERLDALNKHLREKLDGTGIDLLEVEVDEKWLNKGNWTSRLKPVEKLDKELNFVVDQLVKDKEHKELEKQLVTKHCEQLGINPVGWIGQLEFKTATEVIAEIDNSLEKQEEIENVIEHDLKPVMDVPEQVRLISNTIRVTGAIEQLQALNEYLVASDIKVEQVVDDVAIDDLPF